MRKTPYFWTAVLYDKYTHSHIVPLGKDLSHLQVVLDGGDGQVDDELDAVGLLLVGMFAETLKIIIFEFKAKRICVTVPG